MPIHWPLAVCQTEPTLYVPERSLPSDVASILALYVMMAVLGLGKTTLKSLKSNDFMSDLDIPSSSCCRLCIPSAYTVTRSVERSFLNSSVFLSLNACQAAFSLEIIASLSSGAANEIAIVARSAVVIYVISFMRLVLSLRLNPKLSLPRPRRVKVNQRHRS